MARWISSTPSSTGCTTTATGSGLIKLIFWQWVQRRGHGWLGAKGAPQ
ncbi:MAG: hypothetical protein R3A44_20050 [Caldilineaceae bacterium]